jgi:uncharacterized C2H2 Zn-finger protein
MMGLFGKKNEGKGKEQQQKKLWKCDHCNMIFEEKERMKRHMKKAHGEKSGGDMPSTNPFGFG